VIRSPRNVPASPDEGPRKREREKSGGKISSFPPPLFPSFCQSARAKVLDRMKVSVLFCVSSASQRPLRKSGRMRGDREERRYAWQRINTASRLDRSIDFFPLHPPPLPRCFIPLSSGRESTHLISGQYEVEERATGYHHGEGHLPTLSPQTFLMPFFGLLARSESIRRRAREAKKKRLRPENRKTEQARGRKKAFSLLFRHLPRRGEGSYWPLPHFWASSAHSSIYPTDEAFAIVSARRITNWLFHLIRGEKRSFVGRQYPFSPFLWILSSQGLLARATFSPSSPLFSMILPIAMTILGGRISGSGLTGLAPPVILLPSLRPSLSGSPALAKTSSQKVFLHLFDRRREAISYSFAGETFSHHGKPLQRYSEEARLLSPPCPQAIDVRPKDVYVCVTGPMGR